MAVDQMKETRTNKTTGATTASGGGLHMYKAAQGKHTRWGTVIGGMILTVIGAYRLSEELADVAGPLVRFGIPTLVVVAIGLLLLWIINRPKTADFLIATEGEMKKVSWSSKKEIAGSTKVVIITTIILAAILFGVDLVFIFVFGEMGVTGVGA
jgi:preprotein translocase subunit SecE